jgi:hypothetical protein
MTELVREAARDGHRVVLLRCYDGDAATVVEYEAGADGERRGSYRFATAPEAFRFVQEALLALQYLGCSVA